MFTNRLKYIFISIALIAFAQLGLNIYFSYQFDNNPISSSIKKKIEIKENELQYLALKHYNIKMKIPIIITDKIDSKLFGLASLDLNNNVKIYLNKKRMKESLDFMIEDVLPHEYAHAIMFIRKLYTKRDDGHSKEWQNTCINLNGIKCERFVKHNDIVFGKLF